MSWSFAHKDGLGVISHTGPNGYSFIEVSGVYSSRFMAKRTPNEACIGMSNRARHVANESLCMPPEGTEITVDEARRRMNDAAWVAKVVEDVKKMQNTGRVAVLWTETKKALNRATRGDLIGEYTDTCRLYEKYLGDGMYRLTYCVDGYDDARIEVSATTVGKTTLLDWITDQGKGIPGGPMLDMTPRRWQLAPGDGIFDGRQPEKFGSVCRCGALLAKAYRSAPRCTKCGFDPMEV